MQFPILEACAITVHKSQGSTYDKVVYNYLSSHEQPLVYVELSRATSIKGLYLTNQNKIVCFIIAREKWI